MWLSFLTTNKIIKYNKKCIRVEYIYSSDKNANKYWHQIVWNYDERMYLLKKISGDLFTRKLTKKIEYDLKFENWKKKYRCQIKSRRLIWLVWSNQKNVLNNTIQPPFRRFYKLMS